MDILTESVILILTGPFFWLIFIILVLLNFYIYYTKKNNILFRLMISMSLLLIFSVVLTGIMTNLRLSSSDTTSWMIAGVSSITVALVLVAIVIYLIIYTVVKPLNTIIEENEYLAKGDLSQSMLDWKYKNDEIYKLSTSLNAISNNFKDIISNISNSTATINSSTTTMSSSIQELNASFEQITAVVGQIATGSGNQNNLISQSLQRVVSLEEQFQEHSKKISRATNLIQSISNQVNMLALNASIEAARLGEYGRGFSIVADNIRELADQTKSSLVEIEQSVFELNSGLNSEIQVIKKDVEEVLTVSELTSAGVEEASASTEEQSAALQEITASSQELNHLFESLESLVKQFKITKSEIII